MANVFTSDSNCKALWNLEESSGSRIDSIGNNDLTDNNTVLNDTVNYKQGVASADFEATNSEYLSIADASLDAGFPLKSDDTNKIISVCGWVRMESLSATESNMLFAKYDGGAANKRSFAVDIQNIALSGRFRIIMGYNGGASGEFYTHGTNLSLATWYHFTATYENAGKTYSLRIKDTNGNTVGTDLSGTATLDVNKLNVEDGILTLGVLYAGGTPTAGWYHDGLIDEVAVFDDVITSAEATQIAQGTYGATAPSVIQPKIMGRGITPVGFARLKDLIIFGLILAGIGLSLLVGNFLVQEYNSYKLFKKDYEEFKQASIAQIEQNRINISAIVDFINKNTKK